MHRAYFELVVCGILINLNRGQSDLIASYLSCTRLKKKREVLKTEYFYVTYFKMVFFMKELMREKLGTKLKLEVELDFMKIAGVLSCVYSQREQKKCLSHGSVQGCCSYKNGVSWIRAWSSLPKCVLTVKGRLIIYLSFWNSSAPCDCFLNILWSLNVTSRCLWWLSKQYLWKTSFLWNGRDILQAVQLLSCFL